MKTKGRRSVEYLQKVGALNNPGTKANLNVVFEIQNFTNFFAEGIPTTLIQSGQQWDFPNVWPPLEHMIITGWKKKHQQFFFLRFIFLCCKIELKVTDTVILKLPSLTQK